MRPVIFANKVSSLPRPTFKPGFTRVPRCRTIMVPPGTSCPPKALNPSRCEFESRPLRDDRKSTRLNSSHITISYAVFCLKKKKKKQTKIKKKKKKKKKQTKKRKHKTK